MKIIYNIDGNCEKINTVLDDSSMIFDDMNTCNLYKDMVNSKSENPIWTKEAKLKYFKYFKNAIQNDKNLNNHIKLNNIELNSFVIDFLNIYISNNPNDINMTPNKILNKNIKLIFDSVLKKHNTKEFFKRKSSSKNSWILFFIILFFVIIFFLKVI